MFSAKHLIKTLFAALFFTYLTYSWAGVREFNEAMKAGDYQTAASETKSIWAEFDLTNSSAPTIAREFAFVNYLAGDYDAARMFISHLVDGGGALSERDQDPVVSEILANLIAYRSDSESGSRDNLIAGLQQRLELTGSDNISLVAAEYLYNSDWSRGAWSDAHTSAEAAVELLTRGGSATLARKRRAELITQVADFFTYQDSQVYDGLVDLHDAIVTDVDMIDNTAQRETLITLKWGTHAWVKAIEALYTSYYSQTGSHINKNIRPRELKRAENGFFYEYTRSSDPRPSCKVDLSTGKLRYPRSAAFKGTVGAVIVKLDFDDKGKASNPEILAAIPSEKFADNVLEAASSFRLEPERGQDLNACKLAQKNAVVPITFLIR